MKYFILFGLVSLALNSAAERDYDDAIKEASETFPGLINGTPEIIKVIFDNGAYFDLGKNITPTETKNLPVVIDWKADSDTYYTLFVVDPDAPTRDNPFIRDDILWTRVNILGKDIDSGEDLVEYVSLAPPKQDSNRYFYFIFAQPKTLEFDEKRVSKYEIDGRLNFSLLRFSEKYQMGSPIGLNFATAYFDEQSVAVYKQLNCCKELY